MNQLNPTNTFSTDRFIHLCKRSFVINQRQWLIGLIASIGIVITIWMVPTLFILVLTESEVSRFENSFHIAFMTFTLWGLLFTSDIFQELNTPATAFQSLTLPATSTEKFLSAWFITVPVFLIITIIAISLITLLSALVLILFGGTPSGLNIYYPLDRSTWDFALNYLFLNSLFLLGAIYFRKNNFLKTIASFIALMLSFFIVWGFLGWAYIHLLGLDHLSFEFITSGPISNVLGSLSKWVITSIALLLTYVSLKRQQVV